MKAGQHSTSPELTGKRVLRLKQHLNITYYEMAELFGVRQLTVMRWVAGTFAPRLVHQRTLTQLERKHGIEGIE